jgi:HTH-type transcriptional regulator / antitoxin HigA
MALKTRGRKLPASYFALVQQFPLVHIEDDAQLAAAQNVLDVLLQQDLDAGQRAYLDALTDLIECYEDEHVAMADVSEADVLRELMRANGLSQARLADEVGMAQSTISAVLNGSRSLTKRQVLALCRFFRVAPAAFLSA